MLQIRVFQRIKVVLDLDRWSLKWCVHMNDLSIINAEVLPKLSIAHFVGSLHIGGYDN